MRRHKLLCLERTGLIQEYGDGGYANNGISTGIDGMPGSGDALEDEKMRVYMIKKSHEESTARERRLKRLRKLARMDFKMVGGVAPVSGAGSSGSMASRS